VTTTITPVANALDSLQRVARDLAAAKAGEALALKGALTGGWHAVGLLAYVRLRPHRAEFDAWVQDYLGAGEPTLNVERDARWEERQRLSFFELLDLFSAVELPILKPEFYQGWTDRTSRCHELRRKIAGIIGASLTGPQRDRLLLLLAAYHRLARLPAGVALDAAAVRAAMPALLDLAQSVVDDAWPEAGALRQALQQCGAAL
jgi:hypothetical protein